MFFIIIYYLFLLVLFLFMLFLAIYYNWPSIFNLKRYKPLPGPAGVFLFGSAIEIAQLHFSEVLEYMGRLIKKYGPVVYVEILGMPNVLLNDPDDIEMIMNNSQHIKKGALYELVVPWLCQGLLTSTGAKWHQRRKMLTKAFHFKILEEYIPIYNSNSKLLAEKLSAASSKDSIDIDSYVSLCALDVICETAMGTHLGSQMGEASEYVAAIRRAGQIVLMRSLNFLMYKNWLFNLTPTGREFRKVIFGLHSFTEKVIRDRKAARKQLNSDEIDKRHKSFLDCLIEIAEEDPKSMTDLDIREEVDTFMFEGHDTTSVAITWSLFMLALHEDIQERVREEIEDIFGESDRDVTLEDIHRMQYLEMTIKESLRLFPSVPYIARYITTDLKLGKYIVPSQTDVSILPYHVHRNPTHWPQPEKFDPDRFLPHVIKDRHPFAYIPFSAGFRNCIGQKFAMLEEKVIICNILRKVKLKSVTKLEDIKFNPQLVLRPYPKIRLAIFPITE